jgi:hypothetical protein
MRINMLKIRNLVFGCAMGLASAIAPMSAAQAVPLGMPAVKVETKSDVTEAQFCYGYGCERPRYHRRHYRPHYGYQERRYYRPRYERPRHYGGRRSHVNWCASRYRTYDPYTNRYHAGGGVYRLCYSPYR